MRKDSHRAVVYDGDKTSRYSTGGEERVGVFSHFAHSYIKKKKKNTGSGFTLHKPWPIKDKSNLYAHLLYMQTVGAWGSLHRVTSGQIKCIKKDCRHLFLFQVV